MKLIRLLFSALGLLLLSTTLFAQLDVMTYNLRYATERDGENAWSIRKADVAALIAYYQPAIVGVQEALHGQMNYVDSMLSTYTYVGVGRDDGATKGEFSAIFFDSTQLTLLTSETFWLSDTPNEPSFGWGANFRRICTYGSFLNRGSGDTLHVFNTHFDHEVKLARLNGAQVILDKVTQLNILDQRLVLMGDFNCLRSDPPLQILSTEFEFAATRSAKGVYGPQSTFSGFDRELIPSRMLDRILVRNLNIESYRHVDDRRPNGLWPSDHLPVVATVSFQ